MKDLSVAFHINIQAWAHVRTFFPEYLSERQLGSTSVSHKLCLECMLLSFFLNLL